MPGDGGNAVATRADASHSEGAHVCGWARCGNSKGSAARRPRLNAQHAMVRRFEATLARTQAHSETAAEACYKVSAIERTAHDGASLWMKLAGAQGHKATAEKDWP